jgi:hypothetical protein
MGRLPKMRSRKKIPDEFGIKLNGWEGAATVRNNREGFRTVLAIGGRGGDAVQNVNSLDSSAISISS